MVKNILKKIICEIVGHIPGEWENDPDTSHQYTKCLRCGTEGVRSPYFIPPFSIVWM